MQLCFNDPQDKMEEKNASNNITFKCHISSILPTKYITHLLDTFTIGSLK